MPANLDRCVEHVMGQGHTEQSAYAICNAAISGKRVSDVSETLWQSIQSVLEIKPRPIAVKMGARHSKADNDLIQQMHDYAVSLGATCDHSMEAEKTLIHLGGSLKALGNGKVGGYLIRYSTENDPDLTGDFFTATTDFGDAEKSDTYYHHGLDEHVGRRRLAKADLKKDDLGVWMEAQLAMRDEYERMIYEMVEAGKMGLSSGTASHLVERVSVGKANKIMRWPLGVDASITPTPAEPRNSAMTLKTYRGLMAGQPAPDGASRTLKRIMSNPRKV